MFGKLQPMTDKDRKEAEKRQRKTQVEIERRKRIFDSKARIIGVDLYTLDKQIQERKFMKENEKRVEEAFNKQLVHDCHMAYILSEKEKEERRRIDSEINKYRVSFQRKEDRREYDLNDPDGLKKQLPARCPGDDHIGLACAQKFEGEDLRSEERARIMAEQKIAWMEQQIKERKALEQEQKAAEEAYRRATSARDQRALQLELIERECRQRLEEANARFNRALAEERRQREACDKANETQDNQAEIYNNLTSDMMTENPEVSKSLMGANRCIGFKYKGMTPEEKKKFRDGQLAQIEEQRLRRDAERKLDADWVTLTKSLYRNVNILDSEERKQMKQNAILTMEENIRLSKEQKQKQEYFNKVVNKNQPTDDYYNQFNTTTR